MFIQQQKTPGNTAASIKVKMLLNVYALDTNYTSDRLKMILVSTKMIMNLENDCTVGRMTVPLSIRCGGSH